MPHVTIEPLEDDWVKVEINHIVFTTSLRHVKDLCLAVIAILFPGRQEELLHATAQALAAVVVVH